ncbi:hypothetical protein LCGC14_1280590 [marine sediment metagenome]|uniref:Uncharacterized protein n=1 Tax=marine sediment metagenome TaxID=412755 RepID=A0A0F9KX17_9ZZZZ
MITKQDLETLERLYTPLAKILLEHLRDDHDYTGILRGEDPRIRDLLTGNCLLRDEVNHRTKLVHESEQRNKGQVEIIQQQAKGIRELRNELTSLKSASLLCDGNQQQANRIRDLTDILDELTGEYKSMKADYKALLKINQHLSYTR